MSMEKSPQAPGAAVESPHAPWPAGEAVKAFREYLAVHEVSLYLSGSAVDNIALDLARIAVDFQTFAPTHEQQIREIEFSKVRPPSEQDFAESAALTALTRHIEELQALAKASKRILALVEASEPTDEELLALNTGERFFSESPSKYPEAGHGTQYHAGASGVLAFARAVLALVHLSKMPAAAGSD